MVAEKLMAQLPVSCCHDKRDSGEEMKLLRKVQRQGGPFHRVTLTNLTSVLSSLPKAIIVVPNDVDD